MFSNRNRLTHSDLQSSHSSHSYASIPSYAPTIAFMCPQT